MASQSQHEFRLEFRQWLESELPRVRGEPRLASKGTEEEEFALRRRFDLALWDAGWAGITWPRQYRGRGGTLTEQAIFFEECSRANAPTRFNRVGLGIVGPALMSHGTDDQKSKHLPAILSCQEIWCQGFSEPNAGSDLASIATQAKRTSDGWLLSGQKTWTTLGAYADNCLLLARTGRIEERHRTITAFIVPVRARGITVRPIEQINGSREFSEIFLDSVFVPHESLIGGVGDGWDVAMTALTYERSTNFIERQIRLSHQADQIFKLAMAAPNLSARLENRLLNIHVRAEALRCTVWTHLVQYERGARPGSESNASKIYWSETYQDLCDVALELAGVEAFSNLPAELPSDWLNLYLGARASTIYAGTSEIQRNIIGERGLGLPR